MYCVLFEVTPADRGCTTCGFAGVTVRFFMQQLSDTVPPASDPTVKPVQSVGCRQRPSICNTNSQDLWRVAPDLLVAAPLWRFPVVVPLCISASCECLLDGGYSERERTRMTLTLTPAPWGRDSAEEVSKAWMVSKIALIKAGWVWDPCRGSQLRAEPPTFTTN